MSGTYAYLLSVAVAVAVVINAVLHHAGNTLIVLCRAVVGLAILHVIHSFRGIVLTEALRIIP